MNESTQPPTKSAPLLTDLPTGTEPGTVPPQPGLEAAAPRPDLSGAPGAIEVYVCPECGSWYGSKNTPELATIPNIRSSLRNLATEDPANWGSVTGLRIECQHCKSQGKTVNRIKVRYLRADQVYRALEEAVEDAYRTEEKSSGVKLSRPTRH